MTKPPEVRFGPCCFCGHPVVPTATDPCRVTVETREGKWQVWTCHGACFKTRLASLAEAPHLLDPAHF